MLDQRAPSAKSLTFKQLIRPDFTTWLLATSTPGEMDDLAVTNNGDTDKVLRTVVEALFEFEVGKDYEGFIAQRKFA